MTISGHWLFVVGAIGFFIGLLVGAGRNKFREQATYSEGYQTGWKAAKAAGVVTFGKRK